VNTAQDLVDHLLSGTGGGSQDGEHHAVRSAVVHGVREVMQLRDWLWHTKTGHFITTIVNATATITQGSDELTVSSTDQMVVGRILETPPTFFTGNPRITGVTGNVVKVDQIAKASGSGVTVRPQHYYDLPDNLKDIDALVTNTVGTLHCYITPQEWQRLEINTRGAGEPYYYTIMRSDVDPERWQIRFVGVPTNSTPVYYTYRYRPAPIKYMGYERICRQGTVTVPQAGTTVVGTGTAFPADVAGSVIRFGTATNEADPIGSLTPYIREKTITALVDPTTLTVDSSLIARTNVKYSISDLVDASPTMYTAILSACEMWYARMAGKPAAEVMSMFSRDLKIAMENDVVSPMAGWPKGPVYPTARTMGWHSSVQPDVI
jgi:hypothetical protein